MTNPTRLWATFTAEPSQNIPDLFRLTMRAIGTFDEDADELAFSAADLEQLRGLIDQLLPRGEHNHEIADPDAHVVFDSVCCGAQLYRCTAVTDGLPSKPLIRHGEDACRSCGADLAQF